MSGLAVLERAGQRMGFLTEDEVQAMTVAIHPAAAPRLIEQEHISFLQRRRVNRPRTHVLAVPRIPRRSVYESEELVSCCSCLVNPRPGKPTLSRVTLRGTAVEERHNMANNVKRDIDLGIEKDGKNAVLVLSTSKSMSSGIYSSARVEWSDGQYRSYLLYGDFMKQMVNDRGARGTQKAIDGQFAAVFTPDVVAGIVSEAKAFYAKDAIETAEEVLSA